FVVAPAFWPEVIGGAPPYDFNEWPTYGEWSLIFQQISEMFNGGAPATSTGPLVIAGQTFQTVPGGPGSCEHDRPNYFECYELEIGVSGLGGIEQMGYTDAGEACAECYRGTSPGPGVPMDGSDPNHATTKN